MAHAIATTRLDSRSDRADIDPIPQSKQCYSWHWRLQESLGEMSLPWDYTWHALCMAHSPPCLIIVCSPPCSCNLQM